MSNNVKSIRLDDELDKKIGKDVNFSNMANLAIKEYMNKSVWIPNFHIDKFAGITAAEVIERVKNVKYLRFSESALKFTFYPTSEEEVKRNKNIHAYANGDYNTLHDGFVYFNIKFPVDFLLFLKSRKWEQIENFIHGFLSILYWRDGKKGIMEEQVEKKTLKSVIKIIHGEKFKKFEKKYTEYFDEAGPIMRAEYNQAYFQLLLDLGIDPIVFPYVGRILGELHYPFHFGDHLPSESNGFGIKLPAGYMRDIYEDTDDWSSIVVQGANKNDGLHRAESSPEPWVSWVEEYGFYHYRELSSVKGKNKKKNIQKQ